jgi:hypothetical protein
VYERPQDWPLGVAVNDVVRFTEARAATARRADLELAADEAIEVDAAREQVAPVLVGAKRWVERLADFCLDQCQRAAGKPEGNVPFPGGMAIT